MAYLNAAAGAAREGGTELGTVLGAIPMPAIPDLVAASGTANGTVVDVTASHVQATLNDNFQDIVTKYNALLAALRTAGLLTP